MFDVDDCDARPGPRASLDFFGPPKPEAQTTNQAGIAAWPVETWPGEPHDVTDAQDIGRWGDTSSLPFYGADPETGDIGGQP